MSSASNPRNSNSSSAAAAAAAAAVLNAKLGGPSCGDPYEILGLERSATTADIQKKTRKLLLTCHPDKRRADSNHVQLDKLFHDIQEVKDFLLNDTKRKKYDAAWKAEQERWTRLDAKRQKHLSVFEASLERAAANKKKKKRKTTSQSYSTPEDDPIHHMKRANQQRRDDFYKQQQQQQQQQQNETRDTKKSKTKPTDSSSLAYKQVKLKWSRKKLSASFLESDVLHYLNTKFPTVLVQTVELLGKKGNMALVTLQNSSDCKILVDGLLQSDEMRATKVLAEEVVEDEEVLKDHHQKYSNETLKETMLRREAERESLLRQMEMEEMTSNHNPKGPSKSNNNNYSSSDFPPRFPTHSDDDNTIYSPLQRLEKEEFEILKSYLSPDTIQAIQIRTK